MTSLFYSRYIPPDSIETRKPDENGVADTRPVKKRKKTPSSDHVIAPLAEKVNVKNEKRKGTKIEEEPSEDTEETRTYQLYADATELSSQSTPPWTVQKLEKLENAERESVRRKKPKRKEVIISVEATGIKEASHDGAQGSSQQPESEKDTRHRKIRSKFEKSAKVAASITEQRSIAEDQREPPDPGDGDKAVLESHGLVPLPQPAEVPDSLPKSTILGLPEWLAKPVVVSTSETVPLEELSLNPGTVTSLKQKGYENAFAVQTAVVPLLLPGLKTHAGDICISAATGSGKTFAYALPIVENLRGKPMTRLRGLVVVPTRELVAQARESLELCSAGSELKIGTAVGNKSLKEEQGLLVKKWQRYDPEAYRAEQEKEIDEDEELMNWDFDDGLDELGDLECLPGYVLDYKSEVDILICTPGRLVDHVQATKGFTLDYVQWLVIDEADRLLDDNFQQWVDIVVPALEYQAPLQTWEKQLTETFHILRQREVRKIILSATMTRDIEKLMALKLKKPKLVVLESGKKVDRDDDQPVNKASTEQPGVFELPATLQEFAISVKDTGDKPLHLIDLLERENAFTTSPTNPPRKPSRGSLSDDSTSSSADDETSSSDNSSSSAASRPSSAASNPTPAPNSTNPTQCHRTDTHGTLIFTTTTTSALRLSRLLSLLLPHRSPHIATLTKTTPPNTRRRILTSLSTRKTSVLIASDRASRGLDIPALAHVINYDMPTSVTNYVHRVGRTARAGRGGKATTLVGWSEGRWFWNEVAKGEGVRRLGKVRRVESLLRGWGEEGRGRYEEALVELGREARGERG